MTMMTKTRKEIMARNRCRDDGDYCSQKVKMKKMMLKKTMKKRRKRMRKDEAGNRQSKASTFSAHLRSIDVLGT